MSDILVLNTVGAVTARIDDYRYFEETLRFFGAASFKMELPGSAYSATSVVKGALIKDYDNDEVYLIEQVERTLTEDGEDWIVATGRAAGLLTERLILPPTGFSHDMRSGPAESVMKGFVEANAVGTNLLSTTRAIPTAVNDWVSGTNTVAFVLTNPLLTFPGSGAISVTRVGVLGDMTIGNNGGTSGTPVLPNFQYTIMGYARPNTLARSFRIDATWYDAAGAQISYITGTAISQSVGVYKQWRSVLVSPAGAAFLRLVPVVLAVPTSEVHQWAGFGIFAGDVKTLSLIPGGHGNRRVTNLYVATDQARGSTVVASGRYQYVADMLEEIGIAAAMGWKVYLSGTSFVMDVIVGTDRSATVYIDAEFDTVDEQKLLSTNLGRKNFAYAGGQGDGANRTIITKYLSSEPTGWSRREMFVDARDLDNTQYVAGALDQRAAQALNEAQPIDIFDVKANVFGSFQYQRDWDLGDIVTARNSAWGVSAAVRIVTVKRTTTPEDVAIDIELALPWPSLADAVRDSANVATGGDGGSGAVDYHSENHAARHAAAGADAVTPAAIGALSLAGGTLTGPLLISGAGAIQPSVAANPTVGNAPSTYPLGVSQFALNAGALAAGWPIDVGIGVVQRESNTQTVMTVVETNTGIAWQRMSNTAGTGWTAFARLLNTKMKRAMAYRTTTQSINNSTDTVVSYNAELYDIGGIYDLAGQPDRFLLTEIGLWLVWSALRFAAGGTAGERYMGIFTGTTLTTNRYAHSNQVSNAVSTHAAAAVVRATATTEIARTVVFQTSGGALNVTAEFTYGTSMGAVFLGDYA